MSFTQSQILREIRTGRRKWVSQLHNEKCVLSSGWILWNKQSLWNTQGAPPSGLPNAATPRPFPSKGLSWQRKVKCSRKPPSWRICWFFYSSLIYSFALILYTLFIFIFIFHHFYIAPLNQNSLILSFNKNWCFKD